MRYLEALALVVMLLFGAFMLLADKLGLTEVALPFGYVPATNRNPLFTRDGRDRVPYGYAPGSLTMPTRREDLLTLAFLLAGVAVFAVIVALFWGCMLARDAFRKALA